MDNRTISAEVIVNANAVFCGLAREKMPASLAYKIMKWCRTVESEIEFYSGRCRMLLEAYSEGQDENGNCHISVEKQSEFTEKIAELRAMEMTCPEVFFTLGELSALSVSPSDMAALDPFIKE